MRGAVLEIKNLEFVDAATAIGASKMKNLRRHIVPNALLDVPDPNVSIMRRCAVFQGDDRKDCEARMEKPEGVAGSAQSGGVLRESVTIVPVPAQ